MSHVVAFLNRKGGVGKSSATHHVGGALAKSGLRTLLVDADPQSSLTQGLLGPEAATQLDPRLTIASIFDPSGGIFTAELIIPTSFPNLSLLPGSEDAEQYNVPMPWNTGMDQFVLRDAILEVRDAFDLVLIDCPPHIQLWAWSALIAADGVVVPVQPEDYGAQGMASIQRVIGGVQSAVNPRLTLLGYLVSMYNKSLSVHVTYEHQLRETYGDDVFRSVVPLSKDFKEAVTFRKPVVFHKPKCEAAKASVALAEELIARIAARIVPAERKVA